MNATIISDKDFQTRLFHKLNVQVVAFLNEKGFKTEIMNIGRDDLAFCMGCFGCWIKKPGECVMNDMMAQINRNFVNSDIVVYIIPVIFGQFSANIKNALDRWLPNILPFFVTRPDGSSMHPSRYDSFPQLIYIGYGEDISEEDAQLFIDITKKHRNNAEVLIYKTANEDITEELNKINLKKAGGYL
jgi:multimeric flavodoxin WrbA